MTEDDGPFYRKGLGVNWKDPDAVRAYRRAWWRERKGKIAKRRRRLKQAWSEALNLPADRLRAMREFARQEAARRGVDPLIVYREWNCLTPREREREAAE